MFILYIIASSGEPTAPSVASEQLAFSIPVSPIIQLAGIPPVENRLTSYMHMFFESYPLIPISLAAVIGYNIGRFYGTAPLAE